MPTAEDIDDQLAQIRDLQNQIAGVPAPPIAAVNNRIQRDFQAQKARRIAILNGKAQDLNRQRAALPKPAAPKTDAQRQLEQQRAQTMEDRDQKKVDAIAGQKPQEELAKSRIEQQKENAGTSAVALGAGGHSLADLLKTGSQRYDPATGNVTFTIPNDKGTVTPQQKMAKQTLDKAFATTTFGATPDEVFGPGAPPPVFKADGTADTKQSSNPFGGTRSQFEAQQQLYNQSQPSTSTDISVPKGVFEKSYLDAVPKYGPTFPDNPVATTLLNDSADRRTDTFLHSPDRLNFEDSMTRGPLAPTPAPLLGPEPPPIVTPAQAGAAKIAALGAPPDRAAAILQAAKDQGLPASDPAITQAIQQESADASVAKIPGQLGTVAQGALNLTVPTAALTEPVAKNLRDAPGIISDAYDTFNEDQAQQLRDAAKVRALRGLPPIEDTDPDLVPAPSGA